MARPMGPRGLEGGDAESPHEQPYRQPAEVQPPDRAKTNALARLEWGHSPSAVVPALIENGSSAGQARTIVSRWQAARSVARKRTDRLIGLAGGMLFGSGLLAFGLFRLLRPSEDALGLVPAAGEGPFEFVLRDSISEWAMIYAFTATPIGFLALFYGLGRWFYSWRHE